MDSIVKRREICHVILRRDDPFAQIVIPDHEKIDRGTLRAIVRQGGLSVGEFVKLLQVWVSLGVSVCSKTHEFVVRPLPGPRAGVGAQAHGRLGSARCYLDQPGVAATRIISHGTIGGHRLACQDAKPSLLVCRTLVRSDHGSISPKPGG
jgi:hypothetical protein